MSAIDFKASGRLVDSVEVSPGFFVVLIDREDPIPGFRYVVSTYWNSATCWNSGNYCGTTDEALEEYGKLARSEFDRALSERTALLRHIGRLFANAK